MPSLKAGKPLNKEDEAIQRESKAFLAFYQTFELSREPVILSDLEDGVAIWEVLNLIDPSNFPSAPTPSSKSSSTSTWFTHLATLKRLQSLLSSASSSTLTFPDPALIAQSKSASATLEFLRNALLVLVKSEKNEAVIKRIQGLEEGNQESLMKALEKVMAAALPPSVIPSPRRPGGHNRGLSKSGGIGERLPSGEQEYKSAYMTLKAELDLIRAEAADLRLERDELLGAATSSSPMATSLSSASKKYNIATAEDTTSLVHELDSLKDQLRKSEDNLAETETALERQTSLVEDLTRKVDELSPLASSASGLKDRLDELTHTAARAQKSEIALEKMRKKLEDAAELKREVQRLERENGDLVDRFTKAEAEGKKNGGLKSVVESYKKQVETLEESSKKKILEINELKHSLEAATSQLSTSTETQLHISEELELYQDRVKELELMSGSALKNPIANNNSRMSMVGVDNSLGDEVSGESRTDLKLKIRQLESQLMSRSGSTSSATESRIMVLENLLEDAKKMKEKYEADYLETYRGNLKLKEELEGVSAGGGGEAAKALRIQLDQLRTSQDNLQKKLVEAEVQLESTSKELQDSKITLSLVDRDQVEILQNLRGSITASLEGEVEKLKHMVKDAELKDKMQMEQINKLLMDQVGIQQDGISQREKMIERERVYGEMKASLSGQGVPENIQTRLVEYQLEKDKLIKQTAELNSQLQKARRFIKDQDKIFKEQIKTNPGSTSTFGEAEASYKSTIDGLKEELRIQKRLSKEAEGRYRLEHQAMLGAISELGKRFQSGHTSKMQPQGMSWLAQQRMMSPGLRR